MFLAQTPTEAPPAGPGGGPLMLMIWLVLIAGVFYFLVMRPQKKKDQERKAMLSKVQKGDRVMTIGGIYGEVVAVKENYVLTQVDKESGPPLKVGRTAINNVVTTESAEQEGN
jgi:preprotein translocase subunit YajC